MCLKTRDDFTNDKESFLRHHQLFSILIKEIYDLLILHQAHYLTGTQIFEKLTPFLKARLSFVIKKEPQTHPLFKDELEIIYYIADLLVDKISKIHQVNHQYVYLH